MNLENIKILFVVFHPGTGGNHFCNILSLSDRFHRLHPTDDYFSTLTRKYQNIVPELNSAHFGSAIPVHPEAFKLVPLKNRFSVLKNSTAPVLAQGHLPDIVEYFDHFKNINGIGIISLEWDKNTNIEKRKHPAHFLAGNLKDREIYSKLNLQNIFKLPDENLYSVPLSNFLREDASELWQQLSESLNLDLNIDACNHLHAIWYSKFFKL